MWHTLIKSKTFVIPEIFTYFSTLEIYKYGDLKSFYAFSIKFKAREVERNFQPQTMQNISFDLKEQCRYATIVINSYLER